MVICKIIGYDFAADIKWNNIVGVTVNLMFFLLYFKGILEALLLAFICMKESVNIKIFYNIFMHIYKYVCACACACAYLGTCLNIHIVCVFV